MISMTQSIRVLDVVDQWATGVAFGQRDMEDQTETEMVLPRHDWEAFGSPMKITVIIRPGDELNTEES